MLDYKKIGARIKQLRRIKQLTQERLAELSNVSNTYISHVETGVAKVSLEVLCKIAIALATTPDYFLIDTQLKSEPYVSAEMGKLLEQCTPQTTHTLSRIAEVLIDEQNARRLSQGYDD